MPSIPKQQYEGNEGVEDSIISGEHFLLYLVLFLLAVFYLVIMWILNSSNNDRVERLESLNKKRA
jgi:type VI protein secretion system component VasF